MQQYIDAEVSKSIFLHSILILRMTIKFGSFHLHYSFYSFSCIVANSTLNIKISVSPNKFIKKEVIRIKMGGHSSKEDLHTGTVNNNIIIQVDERIIILLWVLVIISICNFLCKVYFYALKMDVKKKITQNNSMV